MASSIGGEVELDSGSNSNELVGWAGIDRIFREGGRGVSFALWVLRHNFRQLIFFFFQSNWNCFQFHHPFVSPQTPEMRQNILIHLHQNKQTQVQLELGFSPSSLYKRAPMETSLID